MKGATDLSPRGERFRWLLLVFAVAFALRGLHLWQLQGTPLLEILMGDAYSYDAWARRIAAGEWLGEQVFYQAPLYPYFLAILYRTIGEGPLVVLGVHALIGSASCVLLACAGWRIFSKWVGIASGLLLALYAPAIFADTTIQKSVLDLFLLCLALCFLGGVVDGPRPGALVGLGLAIGALVLTRENALIFALVLTPWLLLRRGPVGARRLVPAALFLAGMTAVLAPVAFRNWYVGGEFHLTTAQLGPNLYIGNNPGSDGSYAPLRYGRGDAKYEREDATAIAEAVTGRQLTPREVSNFFVGKVFAYIRSRPGDWIALMVRKFLLALNAVEIVDTVGIYTHAESSVVMRLVVSVFHFGVLAPLALLGVWITWPERSRLLPLYLLFTAYLGSLVAFYVFGRYRLPLAPMTVLFAAAAVVGLRDHVATSSPRRLAASLGAVATAAILCNWPIVDKSYMRSVTHYNLGNELHALGRTAAAADQFRDAIGLYAGNALANNNLGVILADQGDLVAATRHYERALEIAPSYVDAWINLGRSLSEGGDVVGAIERYETGLQIDPSRVDGYVELGRCYEEIGELDLAIGCFERALRLDPELRDVGERLKRAAERRTASSPGAEALRRAASACRSGG